MQSSKEPPAFFQAGIEDASGFIMFPLVVHTMDLVVSAAGILSVGAKSSAKPNQAIEDPYDVIKVAISLSCSSPLRDFKDMLRTCKYPSGSS